MGIITMGIPLQIASELAKLANVDTFIETGTYVGGTVNAVAKYFETVHTIEISEYVYNTYGQNITESKVVRHLGDSRNILPQILKNIPQEQAVLFWLDGHYSGSETGGMEYPYPLMEELGIILQRPNDIILIDDARLFFSGNGNNCPTISDIMFMLPNKGKEHFVQIADDVIFIIPIKNQALVNCLHNWAAEETKVFWENYAELKKLNFVQGSIHRHFFNDLGTAKQSIEEWEKNGHDKMIIFGAGKFGQDTVYNFLTQKINLKIDYFCDNDKNKWGKNFLQENIPCISPSQLESMKEKSVVFVGVSKIYSNEIILQLSKMDILHIIPVLSKTEEQKTLVVLESYGDHSNRLYQNAAFESYCLSNKIKFINLTFESMAYLYKKPPLTEVTANLDFPNLQNTVKCKSNDGINYKQILNEKFLLLKTVYVTGWYLKDMELETWQKAICEKYTLREDIFTQYPSALSIKSKISQAKTNGIKSVAVHIRKGDFLHFKNGQHYFDDDVYRKYIENMGALIQKEGFGSLFIIFSNDTTSFENSNNIIISENEWFIDQALMGMCDYIIDCGGSTFSMWVSYINKVPRYGITKGMNSFSLNDFGVFFI